MLVVSVVVLQVRRKQQRWDTSLEKQYDIILWMINLFTTVLTYLLHAVESFFRS